MEVAPEPGIQSTESVKSYSSSCWAGSTTDHTEQEGQNPADRAECRGMWAGRGSSGESPVIAQPLGKLSNHPQAPVVSPVLK